MIYMIDVDGTICDKTNGDYPIAKPYPDRIEKINKLHNEGHTIIYWTARGSVSGKDWYELTHNQLRTWGCQFHQLMIGKPNYDIWIDDKAICSEDYFK